MRQPVTLIQLAGVDEDGAVMFFDAVSFVDVAEDVQSRLDAINDQAQVFAAGVLACTVAVEDACGRAVGDEDVGIAGYLVPVAANRRAAIPVERPVEKPRRDG